VLLVVITSKHSEIRPQLLQFYIYLKRVHFVFVYSDFYNFFWQTYTTRNLQKRWIITDPVNAFYVTALPCKILIANKVMFSLLKYRCLIGNIFVNSHTNFAIFERFIPGDY